MNGTLLSILYDIHGGSGGSPFVGISPENNIGEKYIRVGCMENAARDLVWESGKLDGYSKEYTEDYYIDIQFIFIANTGFDITGSIVME
ncbi:hypothetical protein [Diplocloster agilis]|uniref:Uncharacterized protein n=1 Tax=Diplocloster agilis TaxID=2850323 RepID=A0A949N9F1_9FIRM|nr:hypothetical protein [Diplocloster agilis]MBU9735287.1 hypothetical protein [Diplocloster agilis]